MVRRGKRSIGSVMPPARTIYIASCRLSRPFGRKFRRTTTTGLAFFESARAAVMPLPVPGRAHARPRPRGGERLVSSRDRRLSRIDGQLAPVRRIRPDFAHGCCYGLLHAQLVDDQVLE